MKLATRQDLVDAVNDAEGPKALGKIIREIWDEIERLRSENDRLRNALDAASGGRR